MANPKIINAAVAATLLSLTCTTSAQSYDPRTQSPLTLVSAPKDPLGYYDAKARVRALLNQNKAAEAEPLAEQITREYPRDGDNWLLLGEVKRSLNKHLESAAAHQKAGELLRWGSGEDTAAVAAIGHLNSGNKRAALDLLHRHTVESGNMDRSWLYDHDELASLRSDPEFLEIAGRPDTTGWSRDYGWRRDLDFLRGEVKRLNAEYRTSPLPHEFERRYEELKQKVPQLSDEEIFVGMNRMLAVLQQGHTGIMASKGSRIPFKGLPFQMYLFPEGMFIVDAVEQHKNIIGSRLISIEGVPVEEALRRVNEVQSIDGDNEYLLMGTEMLHEIPNLVGLGIAKSPDSVRVTLQKPGEVRRTLTVGPSSFQDPNRLVPLPGVETPLFLREAKQLHWHQALPEHDALYVQLNSVSDEKEESLTQYGLRLRTLLAEAAPKNLIVDLRHNGGGSTHIYAEFLRTLIGFSTLPGRQLYLLIGRRTYSAAGNLATELEQLADAVILGEPSSECCTMYASPSPFILPFSKLRGRLPTKKWSLSRKGHDFRREMSPDVPVMITAKDYFAGRDPVMETLFQLIERKQRQKPAAPPITAKLPIN